MNPIKMESISDSILFESDHLSPLNLPMDTLYTEATFVGGKETIKPIEEAFAKVKAELETRISADTKEKPFDPKSFWKATVWKEVEDSITSIFGFRSVSVNPFIEKYLAKEKQFESKALNALVYSSDRFPIDGLVTDKGFKDKTRSIQMEIWVSLGIIRALEPNELTAAFLHEFGHGIDPALVDITYAEVNYLSEYLTDSKKKISDKERKAMEAAEKRKGKKNSILLRLCAQIESTSDKFKEMFVKAFKAMEKKFKGFEFPWGGSEARLKKIRKEMEKETDRFTRQEYSEAYADNFARMYGYGPDLASVFKKIDLDIANWLKNRYKNEKARQKAIVKITIATLRDEHKTSIHRILALRREMQTDIKDPQTPDVVKKQLQEDLDELEKVLKAYQTDFESFQNKCNTLLIEELNALDASLPTPKIEEEKPTEAK